MRPGEMPLASKPLMMALAMAPAPMKPMFRLCKGSRHAHVFSLAELLRVSARASGRRQMQRFNPRACAALRLLSVLQVATHFVPDTARPTSFLPTTSSR